MIVSFPTVQQMATQSFLNRVNGTQLKLETLTVFSERARLSGLLNDRGAMVLYVLAKVQSQVTTKDLHEAGLGSRSVLKVTLHSLFDAKLVDIVVNKTAGWAEEVFITEAGRELVANAGATQ